MRNVRVARQTGDLDAVKEFYGLGLGLAEIDGFLDHAGFSGVIFGLPATEHHLEFTTTGERRRRAAPSRDDLLVLYFGSADEVAAVADRLAARGHTAVRSENPFWDEIGAVTVEDPDGWRVVLVPEPYGGPV